MENVDVGVSEAFSNAQAYIYFDIVDIFGVTDSFDERLTNDDILLK